jgi:hypothetical protein
MFTSSEQVTRAPGAERHPVRGWERVGEAASNGCRGVDSMTRSGGADGVTFLSAVTAGSMAAWTPLRS